MKYLIFISTAYSGDSDFRKASIDRAESAARKIEAFAERSGNKAFVYRWWDLVDPSKKESQEEREFGISMNLFIISKYIMAAELDSDTAALFVSIPPDNSDGCRREKLYWNACRRAHRINLRLAYDESLTLSEALEIVSENTIEPAQKCCRP